jgi:RNA polymerase primary sigma factor
MVSTKSNRVANSDALKSYFDQIKNTPLLSAEEEVDLSKKIQAGDDDARKKINRGQFKAGGEDCQGI